MCPTGAEWARAVAYWETLASDAGAAYDETVVIDAADIAPTVTWGTSPQDTAPIAGLEPDPADANAEPFHADVVMANPMSLGHLHCAEALGASVGLDVELRVPVRMMYHIFRHHLLLKTLELTSGLLGQGAPPVRLVVLGKLPEMIGLLCKIIHEVWVVPDHA